MLPPPPLRWLPLRLTGRQPCLRRLAQAQRQRPACGMQGACSFLAPPDSPTTWLPPTWAGASARGNQSLQSPRPRAARVGPRVEGLAYHAPSASPGTAAPGCSELVQACGSTTGCCSITLVGGEKVPSPKAGPASPELSRAPGPGMRDSGSTPGPPSPRAWACGRHTALTNQAKDRLGRPPTTTFSP